jgi:RHH-type transcriptional regulator, rel operon repressor / antitoxin RelB
MSETLSIRLDAGTKKRLDALSKHSKRSRSFLAAEAIAACVECEEWQLGELRAGMAELDSGLEVSHEKVSKWLKSWGTPGETKAPKSKSSGPAGRSAFASTSNGTRSKMQPS